MPRSAPTLITALGFPAAVDHAYQRVLRHSGRELVSVAASLGRTAEQLLDDLAPLLEQGIVHVDGSRLHVASPVDAVSRILEVSAHTAALASERIDGVVSAIPFLAAASARPAAAKVRDVSPIDGEVTSGGQPVELLRALIAGNPGDLLWLRPETLGTAREDLLAEVVGEAVRQGRSSRAIYCVRALRESPRTLQRRAEVGEQVRVLPELPSRLLVIGTTHAIVPEPLGLVEESRALVRQRSLVEALTLLFEQLWERAAPVPEDAEPPPDLRAFLVQQLAAGAQDEQIARRLGVSLRTVRRRVADLLAELGADTRFQAGAEAVRRGWI